MCGFFGAIGPKAGAEVERYAAAVEAIAFRGRDQRGDFRDDDAFLAHARLSIIDPENGRQPMRDAEDRFVLLFNGELYNYVELRAELEKEGAVFRTSSDTEVMLTGLRLRGADFLRGAEGMFALALWDRREKRLLLARDPLGKKPLFTWRAPDGTLFFSSSLDAFRRLPGWGGRINRAAVAALLRAGVVPAPLTVFEGAERLLPGGLLTYNARTGRRSLERYARLVFPETRAEADPEEVYAELRRAFEIRLRSDVPLGMTFSGGVDSGLLACLARDLGRVTLYNIDYEAPGDESPERRNARAAAARLGLPLVEEDFAPESLFTGFAEAYRHYDEPCPQFPLVYAYQIFRTIRANGTKVVLTGNGGDELFLGYRNNLAVRWRSDLLRFLLPAVPAPFLPFSLRDLRRLGWAGWAAAREEEEVRARAADFGWPVEEVLGAARPWLDAYRDDLETAGIRRYTDFIVWHGLFLYGAASNYVIPDISGLQAQVEVRSPFLDWGFVRRFAGLRESGRVGSLFTHRKNKAVLRRLYADGLGAGRAGREIAYDKKRGMAWNIRWNMWIIHEPAVRAFFERTLGLLDDHGIPSAWFLRHFRNYCRHGRWAGPGDREAVTGFLLAAWLKRTMEGVDALADWMAPLRGFRPSRVYEQV